MIIHHLLRVNSFSPRPFLERNTLSASVHWLSKLIIKFMDYKDWMGPLLFSRSIVSDSVWSHGLQHARLLCPLLSPRVCSNSCPLSRQCYLTISSSIVPLLLLPSIFPSTRVFSSESALHIMWPTYWSFSNSPSNEYSDSLPLSHLGSIRWAKYWSWSSNPSATWYGEPTHWKRPWCWQRLREGREGVTVDEVIRQHMKTNSFSTVC